MIERMMRTGDLRSTNLDESFLAGCLALSDEAGWNQTAADWRFLLRWGQGIGWLTPDGALVASGVVLPYAPRLAWIGMVLVTASWRRHGLARDIMTRCLDACRTRELQPALDATPAGATVYAKLGFQAVFGLTRWRATAILPPPVDRLAQPLADHPVAPIVELDRHALGAGRPELIAELARRGAGRAFVAEAGRTGFVLSRDGQRARQIGPLVARDPATARSLLCAAVGVHAGTAVVVDLRDGAGDGAGDLAAVLCDSGFAAERGFTRMVHGPVNTGGRTEWLYASAGPEFG